MNNSSVSMLATLPYVFLYFFSDENKNVLQFHFFLSFNQASNNHSHSREIATETEYCISKKTAKDASVQRKRKSLSLAFKFPSEKGICAKREWSGWRETPGKTQNKNQRWQFNRTEEDLAPVITLMNGEVRIRVRSQPDTAISEALGKFQALTFQRSCEGHLLCL